MQTLPTIIAEVEAVLGFAARVIPGDTPAAKKEAVHAFINPHLEAMLKEAGASAFVSATLAQLVDFAVDAELARVG